MSFIFQEAYCGSGAFHHPTTNCSGVGRGGTAADTDDDDHILLSISNTGLTEREHLFDKVVTPSDVGKLNRLVIPKQHAEKYFPLDSSTNDKGLVLNFKDRNGKPWRFRYSYWNSSQSYVMTKGWSRFVKDKKLDAGDIVSFQRGKDRLFIDWRHRLDHATMISSSPIRRYSRLLRPHHHQYHCPCPRGSIMYFSSSPGPQPQAMHMVLESVPVVQSKVAAKRLRLFGVNMDCTISESDECDVLSSSTSLPQYGSTMPSPSSPSINLGFKEKGKGLISN